MKLKIERKVMSIKNNIETSIKFGGFYESIHDNNVDHMVEAYEYDFDHVDYKKTFQSYIESYCGNFEDYILDQYKVNITFKDLKLWSPEYYNYSTDVIDCKIKSKEAYELNEVLKTNEDFLNFLKDRTTSYDGYMSFYKYDEALNNKDNMLIMYVLEYIAIQYNEHNKFELPEFEVFLNTEGQKIEDEKMKLHERQLEFESKQLKFAL